MVVRGTRKIIDNFDRPLTLTTTPEGGNGGFGWTIKDTSAAGAPTYLTSTADGGQMVLTCSNTNEVQNVCMYANDVLMFDLAKLQHFWYVVKVANISNTTVCTWGVGSARNDDEDAVTVNAYFKIEGATSTTNIVTETDDNTTNNDDKATGKTLSTTLTKCHIDFTNGLSDVRFFIDGDRVSSGTTFDMSAVTSGQNVQPIVQLSKTASTSTPSITIVQAGCQYTYAY